MNYKKIYKQIIIRAKEENRFKGGDTYYESHHIIPDFMFLNRKRKGKKGHLAGNPNDKNNLVLLTAREHFICHVLFHKIMKGTKYEYQCGAALIFFFSKLGGAHPRTKYSLKSKSKWYEKCRLTGVSSISAARKGTSPVKDAITGIMIGSMPCDHEKILSGEWVHHSRGRIYSESELANKKLAEGGMNNSNCSGKTDQEIYDFAKSYFIPRGFFNKKEFELLCLENGYPTMRRKNFRFAEYGGGCAGMITKLMEEFPNFITIRSNRPEYNKLKELYDAKNNTN